MALAQVISSPLVAPQKNKQLHNQHSQLPNPSLFFQNQEKKPWPKKASLLLGDHQDKLFLLSPQKPLQRIGNVTTG